MIDDCDEALANIYTYLDGELDDSLEAELKVHVERCKPCFDRADFERHAFMPRVMTDITSRDLSTTVLGTPLAFPIWAEHLRSIQLSSEKWSAMVERMHKTTVEKYYRRNRFWYWLFGTDDWLAASWPSQSARIAEELRAIKQR